MSTPEGWYADPQRPDLPGAQRWWNGASWTAHTREVAVVQEVADPAPAEPVAPVLPPFPQRSATPGGPPPREVRGAEDLAVALGDGAFSLWDQVTRNPVPRRRTTDDGEPLAPPVVRGVAWVVDLVLVAALVRLVHVLVGVVLFVVDVADDGSAHWDSGTPSVVAVAVSLLAALAYHALFLRARGATPGKMLLRLVVRRVEAPGRLPWGVVLRRVLLGTLGRWGAVVALLPLVSGLGLLLAWWTWVDHGAVLGTVKQQTLHDLWAGTQVVQRPRGVR